MKEAVLNHFCDFGQPLGERMSKFEICEQLNRSRKFTSFDLSFASVDLFSFYIYSAQP